MDSLAQDLRIAVRGLRNRPGYTAALVATLALGVGASTAMFGLVDAALLRRLPFQDPEDLVAVWGVAGRERDVRGASLSEALDWRSMNSTLTELSVYDETSLNLRGRDGVERVEAEIVSASYFPILGARAAVGRTFLPEEDRVPDASAVIVISDALWQRRFNREAGIEGRTVTLNDRPFTVVGVMPAGFHGVSFDTDVWVPSMSISIYAGPANYTSRISRWLMTIGRLKPGVDVATAQRDLDIVAARLSQQYPATNADRGARVMSLRDNYLGQTGALIATVFGAVLLMLLVACANVTGLQLVRATSRRREMALRLALGASPARLSRQLLVEGAVTGVLGGAVAAVLAYWILQIALPALPDGLLPRYVQASVDARALAFALTLALVAGSVSALVPAIRGARENLTTALKDGLRSARSGLGRIRRPGLQQALVVAEVATALVLLTGTGLLVRSLRAQLGTQPGFRSDGLVVGRLSLPRERYPVEERARLVAALTARLRALSGVASAAVGADMPMTGNTIAASLAIPGRDPRETIRYFRHLVTPGYLTTLGIALLRGRDFDERDRFGAPDVAVVSESMARRYWPGGDPLGARFRLGSAGPEVTVIGVAANARFRDFTTDLDAPTSAPDVYFPYAQRTDADIEIAVRPRAGVSLSLDLLQRAVNDLDAGLPLFAVRPLDEFVRRQSASARFGSFALSAVSVFAVLLAAIGIYGIIAFVVGLSRAEIAIRMALGADAPAVLRLIVRNGLALVSAGVVVGLSASIAVSPLLEGQLFRVTARDPLTLAATSATVLAVALLASWLPARRTLRIEPHAVLRSD
jgi:putative ABC transport system permease protein